MLALWGSSGEVAFAILSASGSVRFSAETADTTFSRSDGFPAVTFAVDGCPSRLSLGKSADLRLTPAFAKSYGVASSRLYSLML